MSTIPPISVLIPTYGRVRLLEEAIQSFLLQDYPGDAELVVLNDVSQQTLVLGGLSLAGRTIRVINQATKLNLGAKRNALLALASHGIVQYWDDDDIYLPHKLSLGYMLLARQVAGEIIYRKATAEQKEWRMQEDGTLALKYARPFGTITATRSALIEAGMFPELAQLQDVQMAAAMGRKGMLTNVPPLTSAPATIYRGKAGAGVAHVTDSVQPDRTRLSDQGVEDMMGANLNGRLASGAEPSGAVTLVPHWDQDYSALAAAAWAALP